MNSHDEIHSPSKMLHSSQSTKSDEETARDIWVKEFSDYGEDAAVRRWEDRKEFLFVAVCIELHDRGWHAEYKQKAEFLGRCFDLQDLHRSPRSNTTAEIKQITSELAALKETVSNVSWRFPGWFPLWEAYEFGDLAK